MDSPGDFMQLCVHAHCNLAFAVWFQFYYTTFQDGVKMAITINVSIDDKEVRNMLTALQNRMGNLTPVMKTIGETVRTSVIRNFEQGGRPTRWKSSKRAKKEDGKTLIDTARLRNSITARAYRDRAVVGTNVIYAAIHHFGGKAGRGRKVNIPARPYLMVQDEDWKTIREHIMKYLAVGWR